MCVCMYVCVLRVGRKGLVFVAGKGFFRVGTKCDELDKSFQTFFNIVFYRTQQNLSTEMSVTPVSYDTGSNRKKPRQTVLSACRLSDGDDTLLPGVGGGRL